MRFWRSLKPKILVPPIVAVAVTVVAILAVVHVQKKQVMQQSQQTQTQVKERLNKLAEKRTAEVARSIHNMCQAQHEMLQKKIRSDLKVLQRVVETGGGLRLSDSQQRWQATNQYSGHQKRISLPQMQLGNGTVIEPLQTFGQKAPVVDEVKELVGGTATIFQRMNESGDMLRVSTNVQKKDGSRAIGTYIPAVNPDGEANPVVEAVLQGRTFTGRAYVVNAWYTAYAPLRNDAGKIIGMLYTGVPQENVDSLRQDVMNTQVGQTGYVYVLGGAWPAQGPLYYF